MKNLAQAAMAIAALAGLAPTMATAAEAPRVALDTNHGRIVLELDPEKAPKTVESFLDNVRTGFYDGTVFHRVIDDFMIQGGGFTTDYELKDTPKLLTNEADNGLRNEAYTVAMARKGDPHSASVQFFINLVDNAYLDHQSKENGRTWGYAVFGRVVEGQGVVDTIGGVATNRRGPLSNVPVEPVVIERASIVAAAAAGDG